MEGLLGNCDIKDGVDIFDTNSLIESCAENMHVNLNAVYTNDETVNQMVLYDNGFNINKYVIDSNKAGISDIRAQIKNKHLDVSLKVPVLGIDMLVTLSGKVTWNKDTEVLSLDLTHSRLPLGITSRTLFMTIAKKFMQSDMISFPSKNRIDIQL